MNSRWRAVVARGAGLTVCAPAGEAECEGCGPVPASRAAGVAGAGGRAGPLRTGAKTVATSCCNVAFQQWVPTIKATIAERGRSGCYAIARGRVTQRTCYVLLVLLSLHEILTERTWLFRGLLSAGPKKDRLGVTWSRVRIPARRIEGSAGWRSGASPRQPTLTAERHHLQPFADHRCSACAQLLPCCTSSSFASSSARQPTLSRQAQSHAAPC